MNARQIRQLAHIASVLPSQEQQIAAFERHSLPGMALVLNPEQHREIHRPASAPRDLVKRCKAPTEDGGTCRRPISANKRMCKGCWDVLWPKLKKRVEEQLAGMDPAQRFAVLQGLPEDMRKDLELPAAAEASNG